MLFNLHIVIGSILRNCKYLQGSHDSRVNGKRIGVNLREHGIQVHERTAYRDIESQNGFDLVSFVLIEHLHCQILDGFRLCSLRHSNEQKLLIYVEHISTFDVEVVVTSIQIRYVSGIIRMIFEDIICVNGLTISCYREHSVDDSTVSYRSKRVTGEVQVRHRIDKKVGSRCNTVYQEVGMNLTQLCKGDSGHSLQNQFLLIGEFIQIFLDDLVIHFGMNSGLLNPLIQELLLDFRACLQSLRH